ncbi:MAG: site-specific integrase [Roseburia sp.]|nr:site-specific integrase [Roseburia sp.]
MDKFIEQQLNYIEQYGRMGMECNKKIVESIRVIIGYCNGQETVANILFPQEQTNHKSNGLQEIVSTITDHKKKSVEEIIKEIEEMIIELQIKGSVREHRNGLLKFTSTMFDKPVYGRSKEEIEKKVKDNLKQLKKKPQKDKKEKVPLPLLSVFYRESYLPYKIAKGRAESTIDGYEQNLKFIAKKKFDKALSFYSPKNIEEFLYSFPQTRKRQIMQGFLNNILERAVTLQLIKSNPCSPIEKAEHKQEQGMAFSFDEQIEFFELLTSSQHLSYKDKCYFIAVFLIGARRSELINLSVDDIDFKNKILHVQGTKTDGSDRKVPLTPLVEKLLLSTGVSQGKYFTMTEAKADKLFREVWEKKKGHKLHDLRHTFGTIQICVEKVDVKTVSLWLGHSNTETTLNTYTHPEQLDNVTFLHGDLTNDEKLAIYRKKYDEVLRLITNFID